VVGIQEMILAPPMKLFAAESALYPTMWFVNCSKKMKNCSRLQWVCGNAIHSATLVVVLIDLLSSAVAWMPVDDLTQILALYQ
jgi:hypothetical protein